MRARLGFSVAINIDTDVLLLDEVLSVGDVDFRQKSAAALRDTMKSDRTVVLVSHSGQMIKELCDRAIWIEEGVSRMQGTPEEVVEEYESYVKSTARISQAPDQKKPGSSMARA